MCPVSIRPVRSYIPPAQLVQARHVAVGRPVGILANCEMGPPAAYEIDRYEDRQNQKRKRDENLEQGSQVTKEEVGVQTAFLDEVRI